jgi:DNA-directed RNA polymerase specialized sigma24 family protein
LFAYWDGEEQVEAGELVTACHGYTFVLFKMAKNELKPGQKDKVLEMLAAGETYARIAEEVRCSVQNIKYYAGRYKGKIKEMVEEHEDQVMRRGYASKTFRVRKLSRLAEID